MHGGFREFKPVEREPHPWFVREEISNLFSEGFWVEDVVNLGIVWMITYRDGSRLESRLVTDVDTLGAA